MSTLQTIKDSAKDLNSSDPVKKARAEEIKRRYTQGLFNAELIKEGAKPVPVQQPKIDLSAAMAAAKPTMVAPATVQSRVPEAPKQGAFGPFDVGTSMASLKERGGDIKETLVGGYNQFAQAGKDIVDTAMRDDRNLAEKATMIGGRAFAGGAAAIGELFTGLGKLALTQEAEDGLKQIATKAAQDISETELAQDAIGWYNSLDPRTKDQVDAAGGFAMALGEIVGLKGGGKILKTGKEVVDASAPVIKQGAEVVGGVTREGVDALGNMAKAVVPDTTGLSESLIANVNRINPIKRQEFKLQQGVSEEEWLRTRGIIGTREKTVTQLVNNYKAIKQNVDEAIDKIPGTYRDDRVTKVAEDSLEFAKNVESPEISRINELTQKAKGIGLTTSEINEIKRFYERNIKVGYLKDPTKTAEAVQKATNRDASIREFLFEVADKNGFTNLRQLNKEIQANRFLADEIAGKMEGQNANNLMSLTDWIVASPAVVSDPSFIAGFIGKKLVSTESVRAFAAKVLAGFPKVKDLPRADLDEITKRAQELLKKQEDLRFETEKNALLADELLKSGFTMSEGKNAFITEMPIPLTRQEQALLRAAKAKDEYEQILRFILDQKAQGNSVGEGFIMKDIDNTPILNPQSRFDPYREKTIDLGSDTAEPPRPPEVGRID